MPTEFYLVQKQQNFDPTKMCASAVVVFEVLCVNVTTYFGIKNDVSHFS